MATKYNIGDTVWVIKNIRFNNFITKKNYNEFKYWVDNKPDWVKIKNITIENKKIIYVVNDYRLHPTLEYSKQLNEDLLYFEESDLYSSEKEASQEIRRIKMEYEVMLHKNKPEEFILKKPIWKLGYYEELGYWPGVWAFVLTIVASISIIGIILQTILPPAPNPCEKYGSDWEYSTGGSRVRNICVNSNGDIKYIKY